MEYGHVKTTPKYNAKMNNTKFSKHVFRTTHNQISKTIDKCNCSAFNNPLGVSKTITEDTIPTVNNNKLPTYVTHINKIFMKHDSKTANRKQKSQGKYINCDLLNTSILLRPNSFHCQPPH